MRTSNEINNTIGVDNYSFEQNRVDAVTSVEKFVTSICGDRPASHNHLHMFKVRDNAISILSWMIVQYYLIVALVTSILYGLCMITLLEAFIFATICCFIIMINVDSLKFMVEIVALLHDVADHKYVEDDPSLITQLNNFLLKLTSNTSYKLLVKGTVFYHLFTPDTIIKIIDRISFSRQAKYGTQNWYASLGIWGVLIRDIVSDGDKLEAIGKNGINRCRDFTMELFEKQKIEYTNEMVESNIIKHYHEKLKLIASYGYMRTLPGFIRAQILDRDMQECIRSYQSYQSYQS